LQAVDGGNLMSMKSADEPGLDHGDYIEFVMLDGTKRVPSSKPRSDR